MSNPPPDDQGGWQSPPPESFPPPEAFPPPGYQQPGYPPPGYQQPPYGAPPAYGYAAPDHPQGTTILVLGILSLVVCQVLGPVAWVMGSNAIKEIDAAGGSAPNRSQVQAGRICGIIASVLVILALVSVVLIFALSAAITTTSTS